MDKRPGIPGRIVGPFKAAIRPSLKTILFLAKIMVPVSLGVAALDWLGAIAFVVPLVEPAFALIGLPGEAAIVFLTSIFLGNYPAIAAMLSLPLTLRDMTILALMNLTAHNMIVETAVMKKTGSSAIKMIAIRIGWAIASAVALNFLLPPNAVSPEGLAEATKASIPLQAMLTSWGLSTAIMLAKMTAIVYGVHVIQAIFEEFALVDPISAIFNPFMRFFGIPQGLSFLWIVINVVGYAYGAGIIADKIDKQKMTFKEGDIFNHHASVCHSLLEDTILYAAIGIPIFWITVPRLAMALIVVWAELARRFLFMRSFRAGTI